MAIKVDRINGQNYAENLVNPVLSFNTGTWSVISGTGTSVLNNKEVFEGVTSLRVQNNTPAIDLTVSNTNQTTTINVASEYQISWYLRKDFALEEREVDVLIYQNAVLLDTQSCVIGSTDADFDDTDVWVRFQADRTYDLLVNDEITFQFKLKSSATLESETVIYIDALMLNLAERGNNIVPLYQRYMPEITTIPSNYVEVNSIVDLPQAVSNVISLLDGYTYMFNTHIDLQGNTINSDDAVTNIFGRSSETSSITSTGLGVGTPLISSNTTLKLGSITIKDVDTAFEFNKDTVMALDWDAVNFENVPNIGTLQDFDNFIFKTGVFLNCNNLLVTGSYSSFVMEDSLLSSDGSGSNLLDFTDTSVSSRRIRIEDSPIIVASGDTGINLNAIATVPDENFILKGNNFSGAGTYLNGIDKDSLKADFESNTGIENTRILSWYYMTSNATVTSLVVNTPTKIAGNTTSASDTSGFTNTNNRATYNRTSTRPFEVKAVLSFNIASDINDFEFSLYKNGILINGSEQSQLTESVFGASQGYTITLQALTSLSTNDYIEVFVENTDDGTDITVSDLSVIIK